MALWRCAFFEAKRQLGKKAKMQKGKKAKRQKVTLMLALSVYGADRDSNSDAINT